MSSDLFFFLSKKKLNKAQKNYQNLRQKLNKETIIANLVKKGDFNL